jgi:hypothetical protein
LNEWFQTFRKTSAFIFKGHDTKTHVLTLTLIALRHFKTSEIIHAITQRHTPEDPNLQNKSCRISKVAYVYGKYSDITSKLPVHHPPSPVKHTVTTYPTNGVSYPPLLSSTLYIRHPLPSHLHLQLPCAAEFRNFGAPSHHPTTLYT